MGQEFHRLSWSIIKRVQVSNAAGLDGTAELLACEVVRLEYFWAYQLCGVCTEWYILHVMHRLCDYLLICLPIQYNATSFTTLSHCGKYATLIMSLKYNFLQLSAEFMLNWTSHIFTHGRSVEADVFSGVCLSLSLFVRMITSERLNVGWWNLDVRCIVQKSRPRSSVKVKSQMSRSPRTKKTKKYSVIPINNA